MISIYISDEYGYLLTQREVSSIPRVGELVEVTKINWHEVLRVLYYQHGTIVVQVSKRMYPTYLPRHL